MRGAVKQPAYLSKGRRQHSVKYRRNRERMVSEARERGSVLCALCGLVVDASLRPPDPMALTVDHVVPVALGGSDERGNLQYAHSVCNSRRGDKSVDVLNRRSASLVW